MKYYRKWFPFFLTPSLIAFLLVVVLPFMIGIFYSFTSWRGTYFTDDFFVGFENYQRAFRADEFRQAFSYTIQYTLISVITINLFGLGLALLVTNVKKGSNLFRTTFFMPNLLGGLILGIIWKFIFDQVFTNVLFTSPQFAFFQNMLVERRSALVALIILTTWQFGGYMMIIFIAAINNIPKELYEASVVDGANAFQKFRKITIPMIMPAFTITIFLTLSNSFKLLDQNVALTNGRFDTKLLAMQIWRTPNEIPPTPNYGLAQAMAVIFFLIIALVTLFQVYFTKKREVEM